MGRTTKVMTLLAALALAGAASPALAAPPQPDQEPGQETVEEKPTPKSPDPRWIPPSWKDVEPTPQSIACAETEPDGIPYEFTTDARIVVFDGSNGRLDRLLQLLQQVDLTDEEGHWIAGEDHFVFMGSLFGYGDDNIACMELLKDLSEEAEAAGGMVHFVLGTSDFLNLRGILSTMPPRAYEHLAEPDSMVRSDARLEEWLEQLWEYNSDLPERQRLRLRSNYEMFHRNNHGPGAMEFLDLIAPGSEHGDWLREANTVVRINGILFVGGGIHPIYADIPLARINAYHRDEFNKTTVYVPIMGDHRFAPYQWPGLSTMPTHVPREKQEEILAGYDAPLMVVAHTPGRQSQCVYKNRVIHVESNLSSPREQAAYNAVLIQGDEFFLNNAGRVREYTVPPAPQPSAG